MKANEIKDMTVDELNSKLAELKQELFNSFVSKSPMFSNFRRED